MYNIRITCSAILFLVSGFGCKMEFSPFDIEDRIAHPDTLRATVDGVHYRFDHLSAQSYFGISARGSSGSNTIELYLAGGNPGTHSWAGGHEWGDMKYQAVWNSCGAIKDSGQLVILEHAEYSFLRGTFSFVVVDSVQDTLHITDGYFRLHYTSSD